MAKHKCNCPEEGAPLWVLTYGDMMSLLLVFFILLLSFSELRRPPEVQSAMEKIKANFKTPLIPASLSFVQRKIDPVLSKPNRSESNDESIDGKNTAVTTVRPNMDYIMGGRIIFENRSDMLPDDAKRNISTYASKLVGLNTKIEVAGHANPLELGEDASEEALWDLSYRRARAVKDYLVHVVGIKPERIRLIASADHEPLAVRVYSPEEQKNNRRATIVSLDTLVEELTKPEGD